MLPAQRTTEGSIVDPRAGFNGYLLSLVTATIFAGSTIAAKFVSASLDPISIILLRSLIALVVLSALVTMKGLKAIAVAPRDLLPMMALGATGIVGYAYFSLLSLESTTVANVAIISSLSPAITAIVAAILMNERLSATDYVGGLLSCGGALLLLFKGDWERISALRLSDGDYLMLIAVCCSVTNGLVASALSRRYLPITLTFYMTLTACGILIPIADWSDVPAAKSSFAELWLVILFMGVVSSSLGYWLFNVTVSSVGPTRASCYVYSSSPVISSMLGKWLYGDAITTLSVVSSAVIATGLYLMVHDKQAPQGGMVPGSAERDRDPP
ncbi:MULTISPECIES: DMT family transporter [unclassified Mesorhizobium]|uniref:DMT family transporter n=1 Tax=unclassified Mesorhizobium TaxID=325217 RepID=UPI000A013B0F|nr:MULTISPECIES: DMT family transporter [unclassified Mesorhizobium]WJI67489.1 DMT family transporter [Mesorhizobium sp. C399B]